MLESQNQKGHYYETMNFYIFRESLTTSIFQFISSEIYGNTLKLIETYC